MGPAGKEGGSVVAGPASAKIDSLEALSKYFVMPEKQVAKELGICLTSLKKLCRQYGVTRWPYRKLKSIQRTMAKVQDDAASPGMAAQLQAAGIVIEGAADGAENGKHNRTDGSQQPGSTGSKSGDKDGKKRKPYTVNGKTVMMTEEEKKLLSISMGEGGGGAGGGESRAGGTGLTLVVKPEGAGSKKKATNTSASPGSTAISPGSVIFISASEASSFAATPPVFSCEASGESLHVRNWAELWTQTHLEQRLLKPLGGIRLTISESGLAILDFENAKTAQRAELICRAAAKAASENLRNRPKSRSRTPPIVQEAKSMTPGPISLGKVLIDIGSGHPPRDPDSTGSQGALFRNPVSPDGVFGSMWDASTLGLSGHVDSHSSESLGSVAVHGFLDSGRASSNPFSGADALLGPIGGPDSACNSSLNASDADGVKADVGEEGVVGGGKLEDGEGDKAANASKVDEGEAMKVEEEEESGKGEEAEAMKVEEGVPASTGHEEAAGPGIADGEAASSGDNEVEDGGELHSVKREEGGGGQGAGDGGRVEDDGARAAGGDEGGDGASGEGGGGGEAS